MSATAQDAHPFPIYNARFRLTVPLLDADGDPISPSSPDTELSQDAGTFADATNEATEIATSSGIVYVDLIATEMDTTSTVVKIASTGAKTTIAVLNPRRLPIIRTGTAQAGAATTITLDSSASAIDDYYVGCYVNITNDTPTNARGQARVITDYVGSTKVATVATWGTNPSSSSTFEILATPDWIQRLSDVNAISGVAVSTSTAQLGVNVVNVGGSAVSQSGGLLNANVTQISSDATAADNAEAFFDGTGYAGTGNTIPTVTTVTNQVTANVTAISGDSAAADNLESYTDGTTPMPVNVTQVSGDSTAADNAESFFDGTGYAGTNNVIPLVTTVTNLINAATAGDLTATMKASVNTEADTALTDYGALKPTTAGRTLDITATGAAGVDWGNVENPTTAVNLSATNIDTDQVVASVTGGVTVTTNNDKTGYALSSAGVQAIWDALTSALTTVGSIGKRLTDYIDVLVSSRASQTSLNTLSSDTSAGILAIKNQTDQLTFTVSGQVDANVLAINSDASAAGNLEADYDGTGYDKSNSTIGTATNVTSLHDVISLYFSAITRKTAGLATDISSIFDAINLDYGSGAGTYDNTTDSIEAIRDRGDAAWTGGGTPPTAAAIADAVWDETLADHLTAGSTGNALNAAGSAGDPWSTTLPGAYGAGSAGKIIGDNLNATVSSRASQASVDTIDDFLDTEVAAIKAKTDSLTFTVAGQVDANLTRWQGDTPNAMINGRIDAILGAFLIDESRVDGACTEGGQTQSFTTNLTETEDDYYAGWLFMFTDAGTNRAVPRVVRLYNGTTKEITLVTPLPANTTNGHAFSLIALTTGAELTDGSMDLNKGYTASAVLDSEMAVFLTPGTVGEAINDAATNTGIDAAGVRAAIGLASANLDTQLGAIDDFLDTEIAAIKAKTDNLPTDPADQSAVEAAITAATSGLALQTSVDDLEGRLTATRAGYLDNLSGGAVATAAALATVAGYLDTEVAAILEDTGTTIPAQIAALNNISPAQVNAEVDTALADIHLDHLLATDYDPTNKPGVATALLNELIGSDAGVSQFTANALELAPSGGGGGSTAADIWAYATRTLTTPLASVESTVTNTTVTMYRGDVFNSAFTGLGALGTWTKVYLTIKKADVRDEQANIQLMLTNPSSASDGLVKLNARTATLAWGSITVDDAVDGDITVFIDENASRALEPGEYDFDIQYVNSAGSSTRAAGKWTIYGDVTRAID